MTKEEQIVIANSVTKVIVAKLRDSAKRLEEGEVIFPRAQLEAVMKMLDRLHGESITKN